MIIGACPPMASASRFAGDQDEQSMIAKQESPKQESRLSSSIVPEQSDSATRPEQREFSGSIQLQSNPDGPDLFQRQWWFLAEQLAFVPRYGASFGLGRSVVMAYMNGLLCKGNGASC
jgi:hypothetical protein